MPFESTRRLFWSELGPRDAVYMLLTVDFAGQTFRWSTQPVTMLNESGEVLVFGGGLNALEYGTVLQTLAAAPDEASVSLDLLWPSDVAGLIAEGHDLSAATGELSCWVFGGSFPDRQVLVSGRVRQPIYGAFGEPVSFTIEEAPFQDVGEWPSSTHRVCEGTWTAFQDSESGNIYPQVLGRPGIFSRPDGSTVNGDGTRALVVEADPTDTTLASTLLIAGHKVKSPTVRIKYMGATGYSPEEGYLFNLGDWGGFDAPVEQRQDALGNWVSVVSLMQPGAAPGGLALFVDDIRRAQTFRVLWSGAAFGTNGGLVWDDETTAIRGAGDVLQYALQRSTLRVDWGRFNASRARMNAWLIDGFLDDTVQPWDWIADNLLPLMPVSMHSGPDGVFPVFWDWAATESDAVDRIEWGPGVVRVTGVEYERQPSEIRNRITLKYAFDLTEDSHQRSVIHTPRPDLTDKEQVTSVFAKRSELRHGVTAESSYSTDVITDTATAHQSVNWRVIAEGFSHRSVTYEVPQEYSYLELGDVVLLTDSDIHLTDIVSLVQGTTLTDTGRIELTLQLVENVARTKKTTGPNPDDGAPDPGDYQ